MELVGPVAHDAQRAFPRSLFRLATPQSVADFPEDSGKPSRAIS